MAKKDLEITSSQYTSEIKEVVGARTESLATETEQHKGCTSSMK